VQNNFCPTTFFTVEHRTPPNSFATQYILDLLIFFTGQLFFKYQAVPFFDHELKFWKHINLFMFFESIAKSLIPYWELQCCSSFARDAPLIATQAPAPSA
jgi:hypothetical protein